MKTVAGKVVCCKPIPLSKAAKVLSKFVFTDNGASPAFAAYLRRASASFDELARLHKEHKRSGSEHKVKKQRSHGTVTEGTVESVINCSKDGVLAKELSTSKRKELQGVNKSEGEAGRIEVDEGTRRHKSKNRGDEDEGRHNAVGSGVKMGVQELDGNAGVVGGAGRKSKQKRENNESVAVTVKDKPYGDHDFVNASELKNGTESFDGSKETKKKKKKKIEKHDVAADVEKGVQESQHSQNDGNTQAVETGKSYSDKQKKHKKDQPPGNHVVNSAVVKSEIESLDGSKDRKNKRKRDKPEKEKSDDPLDMKKEMQSHSSWQDCLIKEETQSVENNGDEQKQRKKSNKKNEVTEERVISGIQGGEQRDEIKGDSGNIENVDKGLEEKKIKKKRTHEGRDKEYEGKHEKEVANSRESKKRKHESLADEGLDNSQEKHKSKKKKR